MIFIGPPVAIVDTLSVMRMRVAQDLLWEEAIMSYSTEDAPFYFRAKDYRYTIRSHATYGWWTGVVHGEQQLLWCHPVVIFFDRAGKVLRVEEASQYPLPAEWQEIPATSTECSEAWPGELGFEECPIRVLRFWLKEHTVGIQDMPDILAEYYTDPDNFDLPPEDVESWKKTDQYVFHNGSGDYYVNGAGDVVSS